MTGTETGNYPPGEELAMRTQGLFAPESAAEARERYAALGSPAQTVVREVASAMGFDRAEYEERVTTDVVETARDALFASLLEVTVGTRQEYLDWREDYGGDIAETGSDHVTHVVWHALDERAVAATFEDEEAAAIATLRRQAFGRLYREQL